MTSVTLDPANIVSSLGFRRVLAYVDIENKALLRAFYRAGFLSFDGGQEIRRLFRAWRGKGVSWQSWPVIQEIK